MGDPSLAQALSQITARPSSKSATTAPTSALAFGMLASAIVRSTLITTLG
jgi:hypothetical protein